MSKPRTFKNNADLKKFLVDHFAGGETKGGKTVKVRRTYFYRHGMTAEKLKDSVLKLLPNGHNVAVVETNDHFNSWPKESYFEVVLDVVTELHSKEN